MVIFELVIFVRSSNFDKFCHALDVLLINKILGHLSLYKFEQDVLISFNQFSHEPELVRIYRVETVSKNVYMYRVFVLGRINLVFTMFLIAPICLKFVGWEMTGWLPNFIKKVEKCISVDLVIFYNNFILYEKSLQVDSETSVLE